MNSTPILDDQPHRPDTGPQRRMRHHLT